MISRSVHEIKRRNTCQLCDDAQEEEQPTLVHEKAHLKQSVVKRGRLLIHLAISNIKCFYGSQ